VCTVSWVHQPEGYHLLCNRDEKRTRGAAFAPQVMERNGVRYIAPIDPDHGGTWLSANEFGLSVCLLNGTADVEPRDLRRSRGLLLRELAWAPGADECALWLRHLDLTPFAPFSILILEPGRSGILAEWNGGELTVDPAGDSHMPLDAYSTCMHREDAETVSFSWVVVSMQAVRFLYSPGAPCQSKPSHQKILARAA
jgi:hypothetical protein